MIITKKQSNHNSQMKITASNPGSTSNIRVLYLVVFLFTWNIAGSAQETPETLFGPETEIGFVWSSEIKVNSIKNQPGTLFGFYGGALINRSLMLGGTLGSNFGHPTVNYSYLGLMGQYTYRPEKLLHPSAQLVLAAARTKDYEGTKSSLFDNFMNTNGTYFYFIEPGINLETNLGNNIRLVTGLSYRYAFSLDPTSEYVELTRVTNQDMSGINLGIGLKFGLY
jgi:hypothetical protein